MLNIKGYLDELNSISKSNGGFSLFISGISSEERFLRGYELLKDNEVEIDKKMIFYFEEVLSSEIMEPHSEEYFDRSFEITDSDIKIHVNLYEEMDGLRRFRECLDSISHDIEGTNIAIDISVLVKPYFFLLLKHLTDYNFNEINLIYTEPNTYQTFTRGTMNAKDIPGYSGRKDFDKKEALAVLLGFEGYRTNEIYDQVNPELTIPINGFPSYKPEFKDKSILQNKELLLEEDIFINMRYAPAHDPFMTCEVLNEIYSLYKSEYNLSITPLGTKPMALGSCFFVLQNTDCRVIYPYPLEYYPKSSLGFNTTWLYAIHM